MKPAEAEEVAKCVYAAYHDSYFYGYMYDPERIRNLNDTEELISYVAVTRDNEVMGHVAIRADGEGGTAELMAAVVKPAFRGQGCLNALTEAAFEEGRRLRFSGLYVRAVTSHSYSQKTAQKFGFRSCCLFLAEHDPLEFTDIPTGKRERESMLYAFSYLSTPDRFRIYPPPHHTEMVLQLYRELGAQPEPVLVMTELPAGKSSMHVTVEQNDAARIEVLHYGNDVISEVGKTLKGLSVERVAAIYLFLGLSDPLTARFTSEFEKMGFFFAGINAGSPGTDRLVLQFLNNIKIDYSRLQFASDTGRQIADYIRQHDPNLVSYET